jgi:hypothetical protein
MALPKRLFFLFGRLVPAVGLLVLVAFGALVVTGATSQFRLGPTAAAWVSALLVLSWFLTRLPARRPGTSHHRAGPDPHGELAFEMRHGRGPTGWRGRSLLRLRPFHGRSPDGLRPRFD